MKIVTPLACAAWIAGSMFGCAPKIQSTTFQPVTDRHLGYVSLKSGERAVIWKHCKLPVDNATALEVTLGRAPSSHATVVVHDPAAPGKRPAVVATSTANKLFVPLDPSIKGTRLLTVLEGPVAPGRLPRLLGALRDPDVCTLGPTSGGWGRIRLNCLPCHPYADCTPCPPPCPDEPCHGVNPGWRTTTNPRVDLKRNIASGAFRAFGLCEGAPETWPSTWER